MAIILYPYICDEVISILAFTRSDGQKRDRSQGEGWFHFGMLIDIGNFIKVTYDCLLVARESSCTPEIAECLLLVEYSPVVLARRCGALPMILYKVTIIHVSTIDLEFNRFTRSNKDAGGELGGWADAPTAP